MKKNCLGTSQENSLNKKKVFNFQISRNQLTVTTCKLIWGVKTSLKQESKIRNKNKEYIF